MQHYKQAQGREDLIQMIVQVCVWATELVLYLWLSYLSGNTIIQEFRLQLQASSLAYGSHYGCHAESCGAAISACQGS